MGRSWRWRGIRRPTHAKCCRGVRAVGRRLPCQASRWQAEPHPLQAIGGSPKRLWSRVEGSEPKFCNPGGVLFEKLCCQGGYIFHRATPSSHFDFGGWVMAPVLPGSNECAKSRGSWYWRHPCWGSLRGSTLASGGFGCFALGLRNPCRCPSLCSAWRASFAGHTRALAAGVCLASAGSLAALPSIFSSSLFAVLFQPTRCSVWSKLPLEMQQLAQTNRRRRKKSVLMI